MEGDTVSVPLFMDEEWFQLKAVYAGNKDIKWNGEKWSCSLIHPVIQTGRIWKNPDDLAVLHHERLQSHSIARRNAHLIWIH